MLLAPLALVALLSPTLRLDPQSAAPANAIAPTAPGGGVDVPLVLWTNADWPGGLDIGLSTGLSWGDYDGDGWYDLFSLQSGKLHRNANGQTWTFVGDLRQYMDSVGARYGAAWGDYDEDGLPDIATEPRGAACIHLLRNLGGGTFLDVSGDPDLFVGQACGADSETNCWGDVDGDGDIDLFVPIYPEWKFNGIGNRFYRNMGPVGAGGHHRMIEYTHFGGFENPPPDSARPEGAQFVDVDADGDLDLYSNGTLYQNRSSVGVPRVRWMTEQGSGILYHSILDEGAAFGDYDMDGDWDLFIAYTQADPGVTIFENQGDGTFFEIEPGIVESSSTGIGLGLSIEDWDGDGDLDFTTRNVFRRNSLLDTGERRFLVATHSIPDSHISSASPTWADWDHDGDLDCGLANIGTAAHFYENTQYAPDTPLEERRHVRVVPVRDSASLADGIVNEFGAAVEVRIHGDASGRIRRKFTSSANGYLNQNEYPVTFALPPDPEPDERARDLRFELVVDFPTVPTQGIWRVDRHVNPVLGDLDLASMDDREIRVWRSGRVRIDGVDHEPCASQSPQLLTAGAGLVLADPVTGLAAPVPPPSADHWVGIDFDTLGAASRVRLTELVLDGRLLPPVACGSVDANVLVWDVSVPGAPEIVRGGALALSTGARNDRSSLPLDVLLDRERRYRVIARVDLLRETPFAGPHEHGDLRVHGGVSFPGASTCPEVEIDAAVADPARLYLTVRFAAVHGIERTCVGAVNSTGRGGAIDLAGPPSVASHRASIVARHLPPMQFAQVFYGQGEALVPFGDGFLCIAGHLRRLPRPSQTDAAGELAKPLDLTQAPAITPGSTWLFQVVFHDPAAGGAGYNTTDALRLTFCR